MNHFFNLRRGKPLTSAKFCEVRVYGAGIYLSNKHHVKPADSFCAFCLVGIKSKKRL